MLEWRSAVVRVLRKKNWKHIANTDGTRTLLRGLRERWNVSKRMFRKVAATRLRSLTPERRDRWFLELAEVAQRLGLMDDQYCWYEDRLHRVIGYDEIGTSQFRESV